MSRKFLQEYITPVSSSTVIESIADEASPTGKSLKMKGLFIQGDVKNHNGRIYPSYEIKKAVKTIQELIRNDHAPLGECDHPSGLNINLDRVSHVITNIDMEGANGIGTLKILPTPLGNIIKVLLESGVKLGVSSRGSGNVDEATGKVSDFEIITIDIVASPSAPNAYPVAVYESIKNMQLGDKILDLSLDPSKVAQKQLIREVSKVIKDLRLK